MINDGRGTNLEANVMFHTVTTLIVKVYTTCNIKCGMEFIGAYKPQYWRDHQLLHPGPVRPAQLLVNDGHRSEVGGPRGAQHVDRIREQHRLNRVAYQQQAAPTTAAKAFAWTPDRITLAVRTADSLAVGQSSDADDYMCEAEDESDGATYAGMSVAERCSLYQIILKFLCLLFEEIQKIVSS